MHASPNSHIDFRIHFASDDETKIDAKQKAANEVKQEGATKTEKQSDIEARGETAKESSKPGKADSNNEGKRKHPEEEEEFDVEEYIRTLEPSEQSDAKAVTEVADTEISKEMKARIISINKSIALHRKARKQSNELVDAGAFTLRATLQLSKEQLQRIETNKAAAQKNKA